MLFGATKVKTTKGHKFCLEPLGVIFMLRVKEKLPSTAEMLLLFRVKEYFSKSKKKKEKNPKNQKQKKTLDHPNWYCYSTEEINYID